MTNYVYFLFFFQNHIHDRSRSSKKVPLQKILGLEVGGKWKKILRKTWWWGFTFMLLSFCHKVFEINITRYYELDWIMIDRLLTLLSNRSPKNTSLCTLMLMIKRRVSENAGWLSIWVGTTWNYWRFELVKTQQTSISLVSDDMFAIRQAKSKHIVFKLLSWWKPLSFVPRGDTRSTNRTFSFPFENSETGYLLIYMFWLGRIQSCWITVHVIKWKLSLIAK